MKFAIGIPTLNRKDLLMPSIYQYLRDFPNTDIHIVDNGKQEINGWGYVRVHPQEVNLGVAGSWNYLCDEIFKDNDYALIVNDDVELGYGIGEVAELLKSVKFGFIQSELNFSVFLISKEFYKEVGRFDELFYPAYYEDSDYLYRMSLLKRTRGISKKLNPINPRVSQTYEKAPELVNKSLVANRERYIKKWGGLPLMEKFVIPFDGHSNLLNVLDLTEKQNIMTEKVEKSEVEIYNKILESVTRFVIKNNIPYLCSSKIEQSVIDFRFTDKMEIDVVLYLAEKIKKKYEVRSFILDQNYGNGVALIIFI